MLSNELLEHTDKTYPVIERSKAYTTSMHFKLSFIFSHEEMVKPECNDTFFPRRDCLFLRSSYNFPDVLLFWETITKCVDNQNILLHYYPLYQNKILLFIHYNASIKQSARSTHASILRHHVWHGFQSLTSDEMG